MKQYYVLDMEWNQSDVGIQNGNGKMLKNEIIQLGIVKIEDGEITDQMLLNVCPAGLGFVSKRIQKLTDLSYPKLKNERRFPEVYHLFCEFIGAFSEAMIFTWGPHDMEVFKENCDYWGIKVDLNRLCNIDLQACIGKKYYPGDVNRKSVEAMLEQFHLSSAGRLHNALTDAINESQILFTAFSDIEEALEYHDKYYFFCLGAGHVVSPFTVIEGETAVKKALESGQVCTYPVSDNAKIICERFRHKKKLLMVWCENGEFFREEIYLFNNQQDMIGFVRKLEESELERTILWYRKVVNHREEFMQRVCAG